MKKLIILCLFVLISIFAFSQSYSKSKVLNQFYIGIDNDSTLKDYLDYTELQEYTFYGKDNLKLIRFNDYEFKNHLCNIILLLVNDTLYGVQYYPLQDKQVLTYINMLNKTYKKEVNWNNSLSEVVWSNSVIVIFKEDTYDYREYFVHYNKSMLSKYPQYKNF